MHQRKVKLSAMHCGIHLVQNVLFCYMGGWGYIYMTDIISSLSHWKQKVTSSALHCRIGYSIPCSVVEWNSRVTDVKFVFSIWTFFSDRPLKTCCELWYILLKPFIFLYFFATFQLIFKITMLSAESAVAVAKRALQKMSRSDEMMK